MKDPANIAEICELQPDFLGYIFYPRSPRYVGAVPDPEIFRITVKGIHKTGVFVDEALPAILDISDRFGLDTVQLHGKETPVLCAQLREKGLTVIKAMGLRPEEPDSWMPYTEHVDYLLFDTPSDNHGGTGKKFDWSSIDRTISIPFFLSGGIGPADAEKIAEMDLTGLAGVDINSRFEHHPGMKNRDKVEKFINSIRNDRAW